MMATLLLPPGVTGMACIFYKDEAELLAQAEDVDRTYREKILPQKMRYNLDDISRFGFWRDVKIMIMTVLAVLGVKFSSKLPVASGK